MNLKLNAFYWHLIFNVMPRFSKYVGIMTCIRTVVRLGQFHTWMSFLSVIWKRFEDSGLADILLTAGTVTQESLSWVMKGRNYNQSVRVIKIVAEALRRKLSTFMDPQNVKKKDKFIALSKSLFYTFPKTQFQYLCISNNFKEPESKLSLFIQDRCSQFPTFAFLMSYLNMADFLKNCSLKTHRKLGPSPLIYRRNGTLVFCIWSFELCQVSPGVYLLDACCSRETPFSSRASDCWGFF